MELLKRRCLPCEGGTKPMSKKEALKNLKSIKGWKLNGKEIYCDSEFKNFKEAMHFVVRIGKIAEREGHHPDIFLHSWNKVKVSLSTHAIKGLSINDFIVAAKINELK